MKSNEPIAAYPSVVRGQSSGDPVGPASPMSYKMLINFPDGPQEVDGIAPAVERYPDTMKVRAIKAGTFAWVGSVQGQLQLAARELPDIQPCGGSSLLEGPSSLVAQIMALTDPEKAAIRKALGL